MKRIYLGLCLLGVAVPYMAFVPWILDRGLDPGLFARLMFANPIASFFSLDVIVSALAMLAACRAAQARGYRRMWMPFVGTLTVGVSLGLPLWLYLTHDPPQVQDEARSAR